MRDSKSDKNEIICPRCAKKVFVRGGIKILSCFECGLQFNVEPRSTIKQIFFKYLVKLKSLIPKWIITNWEKIITKVGNKIISETVIYKSHCWYCKTPINSVKMEVRAKNYFRYKIANRWLGNKKCPKKNCKYFLCNECGRCFCDYETFELRMASSVIERRWVKANSAK